MFVLCLGIGASANAQIVSRPAPVSSGDFRTQTIGAWGQNPSGNNPGSYLTKNFSLAFSQRNYHRRC